MSDNSLIKLMTDGIVLAELQQETCCCSRHHHHDEAHERSLNIDFILGI
ncbi:hypothetical protein ACNKHW_11065 [Shigella flexneri]